MDEKIMNQYYSELRNELFPPEHRAKMQEIYEGMVKEAKEYMEQNKDKAVNDADIAPIDPKTAFLLELKSLLEKYNAQIGCNPVRDDEFEICIDFKDSMVSYPSYIQWLNAGYVSHFKKE